MLCSLASSEYLVWRYAQVKVEIVSSKIFRPYLLSVFVYLRPPFVQILGTFSPYDPLNQRFSTFLHKLRQATLDETNNFVAH